MSWLSDIFKKVFPSTPVLNPEILPVPRLVEAPTPKSGAAPAPTVPPSISPPAPSQPAPSSPVGLPPAAGTRFLDPKGMFLINRKVLDLAEDFEGLVLVATDDGYGTPTYGYGRILHPDGSKVRNGDVCPAGQAEAWLLVDIYNEGAKYTRAFLDDSVEEKMSDEEFAIWAELTFQRGCGRFRLHIAPFLNRGDKSGAIIALTDDPELHFVSGKYNLGLHRRRWAERLVLEGGNWRLVDSVPKFLAFKEARGIE